MQSRVGDAPLRLHFLLSVRLRPPNHLPHLTPLGQESRTNARSGLLHIPLGRHFLRNYFNDLGLNNSLLNHSPRLQKRHRTLDVLVGLLTFLPSLRLDILRRPLHCANFCADRLHVLVLLPDADERY